MPEDRWLDAERLIKLDVLRRVREVILAANDVGDPHVDVIDHVHKMENPAAVRTPDRHVAFELAIATLRLAAIHFDVAAHEIVERERLARKPESQRPIFIRINATRRRELIRVTLINRLALALKIRPVRPADLRPLIPIQPEPAHPVIDDLHGFLRVPRLVRILDAQDEFSAGVPREEPVEKGGARAADVQVSSG